MRSKAARRSRRQGPTARPTLRSRPTANLPPAPLDAALGLAAPSARLRCLALGPRGAPAGQLANRVEHAAGDLVESALGLVSPFRLHAVLLCCAAVGSWRGSNRSLRSAPLTFVASCLARSVSALNSAPSRIAMLMIQSQSRNTTAPPSVR